MNPRPIEVEPLDDFKLLITFQNREQRVFDMNPLLELPIYEKLKNKGFFSLVKADSMCVFWNDEIDLCPDMVYEKSSPKKQRLQLEESKAASASQSTGLKENVERKIS